MPRIDVRRVYRIIVGTVNNRREKMGLPKLNRNDPKVREDLRMLVPISVRLADHRINGIHIEGLAIRAVDIFIRPEMGEKPDAEQLIKSARAIELALGEKGLVGPADPRSAYSAVMDLNSSFRRVVQDRDKYRQIGARHIALTNLVRGLDLDQGKNTKVAARCFREALGYSGVRVYTLNLNDGTWFHRYAEGETWKSRFDAPRRPAEQSEKHMLTELCRGSIPGEEIERAKDQGLYLWEGNGRWESWHIPDRGKCDFVEKHQLDIDENGDASTKWEGHGEGRAREIAYIVLGDTKQELRTIIMLTNWATGKPLFADRQKDMGNFKTFAAEWEKTTQLIVIYQKLQDMAETDVDLGIWNKRYLMEVLQREFVRAERASRPLALLFLDIDHFKRVNDTHGHGAGDRVLRNVAQAIKKCVRDDMDIVARYGGEEIVVILPETDKDDAVSAAERIRLAVKGLEDRKIEGLRVTVSIGVAAYPENLVPSAGDLLMKADLTMYQAKRSGRDRVEVA